MTDRTRLVFVCNPNNPTGTAVRRAELDAFLDAVPDDLLVVLDEAYREFVRDPEVPDGLRGLPRPAQRLRAAHVLQGVRPGRLRVGFAVAHEPVAEALRKTAVPFGVSPLAQDAAVASLARRGRAAGARRGAGQGARRARGGAG